MKATTTIRTRGNPGFELRIDTKVWRTVVRLNDDDMEKFVDDLMKAYEIRMLRVARLPSALRRVIDTCTGRVASAESDRDKFAQRVLNVEAECSKWKSKLEEHHNTLGLAFRALAAASNGDHSQLGPAILAAQKVLNGVGT